MQPSEDWLILQFPCPLRKTLFTYWTVTRTPVTAQRDSSACSAELQAVLVTTAQRGGQRDDRHGDEGEEGQERHDPGDRAEAGHLAPRPDGRRLRGRQTPAAPVVDGGDGRDDGEQAEVDQPGRAEHPAVRQRVGPVSAERRREQPVAEQAVAPPPIVELEKRWYSRKNAGSWSRLGRQPESGETFSRVQFEHGLLEPLRILA